jgi:hypothetical protein
LAERFIANTEKHCSEESPKANSRETGALARPSMDQNQAAAIAAATEEN